MNCKNIEDLLKSDYLDNELGPEEEGMVREHLLKCPACRQIEARLLAQRAIIISAKKEAPPECVWQNIRRAVTAGKSGERAYAPSIPERLKEYFRSPIFAAAAAVAAVVCVIVLAGALIRNQVFYAVSSDDILSVYTLNGETGELSGGFGTEIEEYFL